MACLINQQEFCSGIQLFVSLIITKGISVSSNTLTMGLG